MTARPAGHALVEALIAQGVHTAFGVPGESYLAVLDGFHQHRDQIRFIGCRQEGGAAFMAEAQGKLSGRPGICFVTRGPGATNASIGLHTAFQDSTPMILFVGQVASDQRDREAFQEVDYRQMFGPGTLGMAKWVGEVQDADRLPEYVARAFHTALQGRPGPVVLVLPEDMLTEATTAPVLPRARAGAGLAGTGRAARPARDADGGAAAAAHRRRQRLGCGRRQRAAALCRELAAAGGLRLPLPGHLRQPPRAVCRRRGHRHQPEAGGARARGRPDHRAGRAPGRDDHRRLHAAAGAAAGAEAGAHPCRARGTGPRLCRRPAAAELDGLRRQGAGDAGRADQRALGRVGARRACRLRGQPRRTRGRTDGLGAW